MRADFAVVLDACVLAEAAVADLFLRLSEEPRLLLPKWSIQIWEETNRTCVEKLGWPPRLAEARMVAATTAFPEAMVSGFEHAIAACSIESNDGHVLAVAIHSRSDTIVTFNVRHFRAEALEQWGVVACHPADYLRVLFEHDPPSVTSAIHDMATAARRPMPEMLARLAWSVPRFVESVAAQLSLQVPTIQPADWRR